MLQSLIYASVEPESTIFVATDDYDDTYFLSISESFNLVLLSDFSKLLESVNANYFGLILEQIILAKGETFHGTYFTTFSGYVSRRRGYYRSVSLEDRDTGLLPKSFYMPLQYRDENNIYKAPHRPFYAQEFPISWREINKGMEDIGNTDI